MKTVYRVEHIEYRHGPYYSAGMCKRHKALSVRMCEATTTNQPLPLEDGLNDVMSCHLYFGFNSLISLLDWFILWLDELEEHDYHVAVFNVDEDDVTVGGRQVLFPRKKYRRSAAIRMKEVR
jgi:hypothetical protein